MKRILNIIFALSLLVPTISFGQATGKVILNKATGYTIPLDTIQGSASVSLLNFYQTTASQTIVIPNMTVGAKTIYLSNIGSASFTLSPGGTLPIGKMAVCRWTGSAWSVSLITPSATTWGSITGTLSSQTDLQAALDAKINNSSLSVVAVTSGNATINVNSDRIKYFLVQSVVANFTLNVSNLVNATCYRVIVQQTGGTAITVTLGTGFNDVYDLNQGGALVTSITLDPSLDHHELVFWTFTSGGSTFVSYTPTYRKSDINALVAPKLDSSLANGKLLIGQSYGGAAAKTPTLNSSAGSFSMSNAGVFTFPDASGSGRGFLNSTDWTTFNNKQDNLVSGTNIKTINGSSILGSGNLTINANSKLDTAATSGAIPIGQSYGGLALKTPSGDVTISTAGVTTIGATKVTNAMLAGSIAASKLVGSDIATVGTITSGIWNAGVVTSSGVITGTAFAATGTGGNGYGEFIAQSSAPSAPASAGLRLFAGSTGNLSWMRYDGGSDNFRRTFASTLTANRTFTFQDSNYTIAGLNIKQTFSSKQTFTATTTEVASLTVLDATYKEGIGLASSGIARFGNGFNQSYFNATSALTSAGTASIEVNPTGTASVAGNTAILGVTGSMNNSSGTGNAIGLLLAPTLTSGGGSSRTIGISIPNSIGVGVTIANASTALQAVCGTGQTGLSITKTGTGNAILVTSATAMPISCSITGGIANAAGAFINSTSTSLTTVSENIFVERTSVAVGVGGGASIAFRLGSSASTTRIGGRIATTWTTNTDGAEVGQLNFYTMSGGATAASRMTLDATSLSPTVTFKPVTGTASVAAFTMTAGTNLTTPAAGNIEFDGTDFYATPSTTRYKISRCLTGSATLDFASTGAGAVADLTITVTGAADGDAVDVGVPNGSMTSTACYFAWVSAANTVTIRFSPKATEDPASGIFKVTVNKN